MQISPAKMAVYRKQARLREKKTQADIAARHARAWEVALQAAHLLKTEFGASRVAVFGSLLYPERFHLRSDIDLAAWDVQHYFRAVSRLLDLAPEFEIDLVPMEDAREGIARVVLREGKDL